MSTRTTFRPAPVITNGNMAANITSLPTVMQSISGVSYSITWAGTSPVGTIAVQVSNTYALSANGTVANAGNDWNALVVVVNGAFVSSIALSGNTGTISVDINETKFYAIRVVYTATSGTGTMQATINGKVA